MRTNRLSFSRFYWSKKWINSDVMHFVYSIDHHHRNNKKLLRIIHKHFKYCLQSLAVDSSTRSCTDVQYANISLFLLLNRKDNSMKMVAGNLPKYGYFRPEKSQKQQLARNSTRQIGDLNAGFYVECTFTLMWHLFKTFAFTQVAVISYLPLSLSLYHSLSRARYDCVNWARNNSPIYSLYLWCFNYIVTTTSS